MSTQRHVSIVAEYLQNHLRCKVFQEYSQPFKLMIIYNKKECGLKFDTTKSEWTLSNRLEPNMIYKTEDLLKHIYSLPYDLFHHKEMPVDRLKSFVDVSSERNFKEAVMLLESNGFIITKLNDHEFVINGGKSRIKLSLNLWNWYAELKTQNEEFTRHYGPNFCSHLDLTPERINAAINQ